MSLITFQARKMIHLVNSFYLYFHSLENKIKSDEIISFGRQPEDDLLQTIRYCAKYKCSNVNPSGTPGRRALKTKLRLKEG